MEHPGAILISTHEKITVCDVTNLPYININCQYISIYGYFVKSLTAYYSCADISLSLYCMDYEVRVKPISLYTSHVNSDSFIPNKVINRVFSTI